MAKRSSSGKMVILKGSRGLFVNSQGSGSFDLQFGAIGGFKLKNWRVEGLSIIIFQILGAYLQNLQLALTAG
jgi:hypothetical protein